MATRTFTRPRHAHWKHVIQTGLISGIVLSLCALLIRIIGFEGMVLYSWLFYLALPVTCWVTSRNLWADRMYTGFGRRSLLLTCTAAIAAILSGSLTQSFMGSGFIMGALVFPLAAVVGSGVMIAAVGRLLERSIERRHPIRRAEFSGA